MQPLFRVFPSAGTTEVLNLANQLGIGQQFNQIVSSMVDKVSDFALAGIKSKVPVDTFALRGLGMNDGNLRKTFYPPFTSIVSIQGDHVFNGQQQPAEKLALWLNQGQAWFTGRSTRAHGYNVVLHRSRTSAPIGAYGYYFTPESTFTADWIEKAQTEVDTQVQAFVDSNLGT